MTLGSNLTPPGGHSPESQKNTEHQLPPHGYFSYCCFVVLIFQQVDMRATGSDPTDIPDIHRVKSDTRSTRVGPVCKTTVTVF